MRTFCAALLTLALVAAGTPSSTKWTSFKAPDGKFTVRLPAKPEVQSHNIPTKKGTARLTAFIMVSGIRTKTLKDDAGYVFSYIDVPKDAWTRQYFFDSRQKRQVDRKGCKLISQRDLKISGYPCREFTWIEPGANSCIGRLIVAGNRHFEMMVYRRGKKPASDESDFFESLKIK